MNSVYDPDGLIIVGTLYGYGDLGYDGSWMIEPGKGYWLRSYGDGSVFISGSFSGRVEDSNSNDFSNIKINEKTLFVTSNVSKNNEIRYSLPPKPPYGGQDVRFFGDTKLCSKDECIIEVMNNKNLLKIECDLLNGDEWELVDDSKNVYSCFENEVFDISGSVKTILLRKTSSSNLDKFSLLPAYPNPFNPTTNIQFYLGKSPDNLLLNIFDINGSLVQTLLSENLNKGHHNVQWNARGQSSGIYFLKLETDGFIQIEKLMLIK